MSDGVRPLTFAEVSGRAQQQLIDLLDSEGLTADDLFDRRLPRNPTVLRLLKFVCLQHAGADIAWQSLARTPYPGLGGRAASWLWRGEDGVPVVLVDQEWVLLQLRDDGERGRRGPWWVRLARWCGFRSRSEGRELNRAASRLVLHEIGHIVLHWERLQPPALPPQAQTYALPANTEAEEQAWWYAGAAVAVGLGLRARQCREQGQLEDAWRHA